MSDNSLNQEQGKNQQKQESKKKRRPRSAVGERNYLCGCSKAYLSYPALYTHVKNKHGGVFPIGSNAKRKIQKNDEENLDELFTQDLESFYEEFQDFVQEAKANSKNKDQKIKTNFIEQLFEKIQLKNHEWEQVFKDQVLNQADNKNKKDDQSIYQVFSNYLIDIYKYCSEKFFSEYFYLIYMFSECINKHGHHFIDLEDEKENTEKLFCMGNQILVISRMTNLFIAEHFLEKFKEMQEKVKFEFLGEEEDQIKNLILMSKLMSNWFFHKKLSPYRMEINVDFQVIIQINCSQQLIYIQVLKSLDLIVLYQIQLFHYQVTISSLSFLRFLQLHMQQQIYLQQQKFLEFLKNQCQTLQNFFIKKYANIQKRFYQLQDCQRKDLKNYSYIT